MIKKVLKYFGRFLIFVVGFIAIYALAIYTLPLISMDKEEDWTEDVEIHILTNGVHTDIVVPVVNDQMDWRTQINYTGVADESYTYLALGWGDKGFYLDTPTWAELKTSVALKAAFGLSTTAIHTTFYQSMTVGEKCKKMMLSHEQYQRLIDYITNSFQKDDSNHFIPVDTDVSYGNTDAFYEANGTYSIFKTCNAWANNGLYACGQKCCFWTALDWGIFDQYD